MPNTFLLSVFFGLFIQNSANIFAQNSNDNKRIQGKWKAIYYEVGGKGHKPSNELLIVIEGDTATDFCAGEWAVKSAFLLDPTKKPKALDVIIRENKLIPESKGNKIPCIYDFEQNRLKIGYPANLPWRGRPTVFSTKEGDARTFVIYEKVENARQ